MPLVWTKDALAELTPKREPGRAVSLPYDAKELPSTLVRALDAEAPKFEKGLKNKLGDVALVSEVLATYKTFSTDAELDARVQGAVVAMIRGWSHATSLASLQSLRRHWIKRMGLAFAVRAQWEHAILRVMHPRNGSSAFDFEASYIDAEPKGGWSLWGLKRDQRDDLARAILGASDGEYAEVVRTVGELREKSPSTLRCDLTSLVPTETAWAKEDVRAVLDEKKDHLELRPTAYMFPALGRSKEAHALFVVLCDNAFTLDNRVYDAIHAIEDDAIGPLAMAMKRYEADPPKANIGLAPARQLARGLALFDDERAAEAFKPWIGDSKSLGPVAVEYMLRFPARAAHALAPRLLEKTKGAEPAQQLLARLARSHAKEVLAAASELPSDRRAAVEKLTAGDSAGGETKVAPLADLPAVLRDPPWRRKGARPALPTVALGATPPHEERVVWKSEAHRKAASEPPFEGFGPRAVSLEAVKEKIDAIVAAGQDNLVPWTRPYITWYTMNGDGVLALWNDAPVWARNVNESSNFSEVACMLARFGPAAIPGAIASVTHTMYELPFAALMRCDSPRVGMLALRGLNRGALRRAAVGWMHAFPRAATLALLPIALGADGKHKMDAATALREHVDRKELLATGSKLAIDGATSIEAMLAFDPLFDCPKSPPKLSVFAEPSALPALRLADGRVVPDEGKRAFLEMLQFTSFGSPYVGIGQVKGALDARSVDDIVRALVDGWVASGASSASAWGLRAIGHVGSNALARELAVKIRKWPREKGRPRALLGVDVLGRMGTDVALMHLFDLSKTAKNRHIEARAKDVLDQAATARGLTGDALEDRLVPSLDLEPDGTTTLDYGARTFMVRVDEHLAPHVYSGDARLPSLPRPTKTDDAVKAKAAGARFKLLKSDLETLGKTQLWRFEHAMIKGRDWTAHDHRTLIVDHSLCGRIARKLLWRSEDGTMFRVGEDGTLAGDRDEPITLDPDARVSLPHPLGITADQKTRWGSVLADYAIIQPFEQVGRATFAVAAADSGKTSMDRFAKREIPYGVVFGRLESRGWRRSVMEEGSISTLEKDFGSISATLAFSPPLFAREKPPTEITIDDVHFGGVELGKVPAVAYSEAMYDLSVFTSREP
jgi:hypothetical protein